MTAQIRWIWRAPWLAPILALASGLSAALAHPPFNVLPGLLGYAVLLRLADGADAKAPLSSAFWRGWLAGLAYFGLGCWWVAEAFLVDERQAWMAPFGPALLAAGLALFWGLAALVYRRLAPRGARRVLVFAGALAAAEWLRGHILTGFPWNLPGESWAAGSPVSQGAALVGAYGLTWLTLAIFGSAAVALEGRRGRIAALIGVGLLAGLYGFGAWRLHQAPDGPQGPRVRIVQADIPQSTKYDEAAFRGIVARYLALTARPGGAAADIVVWPEGAIPDAANSYLAPGAWTRAAIGGVLRPGQVLLVGAYRIDGPVEAPRYYNTLLAVRRGPAATDLAVEGVYDKHRLTPFGEYLPLDAWMGRLGIKQLVAVGEPFSPGPPSTQMALGGLGVLQPLICYESLFPGFTRAAAAREGRRARLIVNVSNDAWFGATSGPRQHLNLASYRAIEEGLPMVRATPTGVSALVDAYGRVVPGALLGHGRSGILDAQVPPPAENTLFAKAGDWIFCFFLVVSALAAVRRRTRSA